MAERLKRVVLYSIALGPRFLKWKILSLSGPNALLFLQHLIALVTMSAVNVSAISIGFLLVSLVTNQVSLEEECLPSFEVLNLATSCLDDKNKIPLKVIASFSAMHFALLSISLIVLSFGPCSQQNLSIFAVYAHRCVSGCLFSLGSSDEVGSSHHVQYLCWYRFLVESVPSSKDVVRCCFE